MAVDVTTAGGFEAGAPRALFDPGIEINPRGDHYAVARDGQRFLLRRPVEGGTRDPWTIIVNWSHLLRPAG